VIGKYYSISNVSGSGLYYSFGEDQSYKYSHYSCTGGTYGEGTYTTGADSVIFEFSDEIDVSGNIHLKKLNDLPGHLNISITTIDSVDNYPLIGYNAILQGKNAIISGATGDVNGNCRIKTSDFILPVELIIDYTGYQPLVCEINEFGSYHVDVKMSSSFISTITKGKRIYRKIKFGRRKIIFGTFEDLDWKMTLKRIRRQKTTTYNK